MTSYVLAMRAFKRSDFVLGNKIKLVYVSEPAEQFEVDYSGIEFILESREVKIIMDRKCFEELRDKFNKLDKEVN